MDKCLNFAFVLIEMQNSFNGQKVPISHLSSICPVIQQVLRIKRQHVSLFYPCLVGGQEMGNEQRASKHLEYKPLLPSFANFVPVKRQAFLKNIFQTR